MLKYLITKELALKFNPHSMPADAVTFALQLNIELKTEDDYIKEWGENNNPLEFKPAILTTTRNGFAIFYKADEEYKNFYILHECSHYIYKHHKDGYKEENDSNLLTYLLTAPVKDLISNNIYSSKDISLKYKMPLDKAETYYKLLCENDMDYFKAKTKYRDDKFEIIREVKNFNPIIETENSKYSNFQKRSLIFILIFSIIIIVITTIKNQKPQNIDINNIETIAATRPITYTSAKSVTESTTEPVIETTAESVITEPSVPQLDKKIKVTKSGKKYHLPDCQYVAYKNNTIELEIEEALRIGYTPCSVCRPE